MSTISAPEGVKLPEDLQAHIENARNNVTILEAEYKRLTKLCFDEKEVINNVHAEKVNVEAQIETIKKLLEVATTEYANKKFGIIALETESATAQQKLNAINAEVENQRASLVKRNADVDAREVSAKAHEDNLNAREISLLEKETRHESKVERLKRVIETE